MIIKVPGGIKTTEFNTEPLEEYDGKRFACRYSYKPLTQVDRWDLAGANKVDIRSEMYTTEVGYFIRLCAKRVFVSMDSISIVDSDEEVTIDTNDESHWLQVVPGLSQDCYEKAIKAGGDSEEEKKD